MSDTHMPENPTPVTELQRREQALVAKREFEAFIRGADARTELIPRGPIKGHGFAVADLMLMKILNGVVKPKSAKEAIEVAKGAIEIARREAGESDTTIVITSPEQREKALLRGQELYAKAVERASIDAAHEADGIEDAIVIDDDVAAGTAAGSVPHSTAGGLGARRVRPQT